MNKLISKIYYDPTRGFKGINDLLKRVRLVNPELNKTHVKDWLSKQTTYTVHKLAKRTYKRNKVLVSSIDEQWQAVARKA